MGHTSTQVSPGALALRPKSIVFEEKWSQLMPIASAVLRNEHVPRQKFHDSFMDVYELCTSSPENLVDRLYTNMFELVSAHVTTTVDALDTTDELLVPYANAWASFQRGAANLDGIFEYLNRQLKKHRQSNIEMVYDETSNELDMDAQPRLGIDQLCMLQWRTLVFEPSRRLRRRLVDALLQFVRETRSKLVIPLISNEVVKAVIESFILCHNAEHVGELQLYKDMFENDFLAMTHEYYEEMSEHMLATLPFDEYMAETLAMLKGESCRAKHLYPSSHDTVLTTAQHVMVGTHLGAFNAHIDEYMVEGRDMRHMYELLRTQRPLGLVKLLHAFCQHVRTTGEARVKTLLDAGGADMPTQFVTALLQVYGSFNAMLSETFKDDQDFEAAMERAMTASVNYRDNVRQPPKASEMLARYCDSLLRKPKSSTSVPEGIEERLARAILIFRFVDDKDIFQKFYQKMLAMRLIHWSSASMEAESAMVDRLKAACGYEFTSKLQRMLTDMKLSDDMNKAFVEYIHAVDAVDNHRPMDESASDTPLTAHVLTSGSWPLPLARPSTTTIGDPSSTAADASELAGVPQSMHQPLQQYMHFYAHKHSGRKLTWMFNLCTVEVQLTHLPRPYTVSMSVHQLCILECFERSDDVTMEQLRYLTSQSEPHLSKSLMGLVDSGLITAPSTEWTEASVFSLNMTYTNRRSKVKIVSGSTMKLISERPDSEIVHHTVTQDRKLFIECSIVSIMKTRKVLNHNGLVQEVIGQCRPRFSAEVASIKTIIEALIEKQYIQRTDNHDEYKYLA